MSSTRKLLLGIAVHLNGRRRRQLLALCAVTVATALSELVSLGSVVPFLAVLADPNTAWRLPWVRQLATAFGWSSPARLIIPAAMAFAVAAVAASLIRLFNLWYSGRLAAAIGSDLSREAYRRTLYQDYEVHINRNSGNIINSMFSQISTSVGAINLLLLTCTATAVSVSLFAGLLWINWIVAIGAASLFGSAYLLIGSLSQRELSRNGFDGDRARSLAIKALQEGLGAIRDVLLDQSQSTYVDIFSRSDRPMRRLSARTQFLSGAPKYLLEALGMVGLAVASCLLLLPGNSAVSLVPLLGAFALGAQRLLPAMQQAYSGWSSLKGYNADLAGVLAMLEQPLPPVVFQQPPFKLRDRIRFESVCFSYAQVDVLRSLSFSIASGERVGLIGSTGSGKSTTVDLLMGLLAPLDGVIEIDGQNLHDPACPERLAAWRSAIAHVPQSIYLADSSIAENIAFGTPADQIDLARVHRAAQQAQISSFIEASQGGYDSLVGERGIRLSGGQRQRLGIARALYKQAQVLILDEATSALDNATEQSVMEAIDQLDRNLTVVMIAHRLTTVAKCDRLIRLEHGRVVADGPPSEVLKQV